ncbi:high-potential iron-sulfur protein [Paraburkholderia rhizosphaerae]|uniref:High-potential iron-sulfur protein n=1 Tax=Paraburkholderia rhizosphaerae TaxID=480658 RepID=A0A4R8LA24_9BURK|nr:high-potential iron-sulfur protein [Paraburkholderia rhizosphaerae]TDY39038.1 high potential iron-sulfur protein [Paraburkholderia rhizosphaerae]
MALSRRHFMILAASVASTSVWSAEARANAPVLSENDPTAKALGYTTDANTVDKAKFPRYETGQTCANCQLYQGKPGSANGPCPTYGGKLVAAKGWCNAYVKKT